MWTDDDRDVMREVYRLLQRNADPVSTEEYWQDVIDQGNGILYRHPDSLLAVNMVCAAWGHLEEVLKLKEA